MTPERRRLLQAAAAASLAGTIPNFLARALAAGSLPSIPGVNTLVGTAKVNGKDAKVGTPVAMGDKVSTGAGSYAVIVLSKDAFLVRADSTVEFNEANGVLGQIRLQRGEDALGIRAAPLAAGTEDGERDHRHPRHRRVHGDPAGEDYSAFATARRPSTARAWRPRRW